MEQELFDSKDRREPTIIDDYSFCGPDCDRPAENATDIWCLTVKSCEKRACNCHLFSRDKEAPPHDPDSWRHEANPRKKIRKDDERIYRCFCVEKIDY